MGLKAGWCWGVMLFCLHLDVPINDKRGRGGGGDFAVSTGAECSPVGPLHGSFNVAPAHFVSTFLLPEYESNTVVLRYCSYPIKTEVPVVHNSCWNHNKIVPVTLLTEVLTRVITHPRF